MWRRTGAPMLGIERLPSGLAVDIANRRQAWALLPRVGKSANANLSRGDHRTCVGPSRSSRDVRPRLGSTAAEALIWEALIL